MAPSTTIPDGAVVWVKDPAKDSTAAFVKASVVKFTEGRGYTVAMPNGEQKTVRAVDCAQANPDGMSAPDNCYLIHISESTILDNMRLRFAKKLIYTYTSNILIAVNPFEELTVYGQVSRISMQQQQQQQQSTHSRRSHTPICARRTKWCRIRASR